MLGLWLTLTLAIASPGWWRRSCHVIVGQFTMISLSYHNNVWHPESLYGMSWLQPTSKVNGSRLRWSIPNWWTTQQSGNLVSPFHDNSGLSWTVSAPVKGIAELVERYGVLQTLICAPVVRPKRCPISSIPALIRNWLKVWLCWWFCYCLTDQLWVLISVILVNYNYNSNEHLTKKSDLDN